METLEFIDCEGGITEVRVHQLVKSVDGDVLSDSKVWHVYAIANGLIERAWTSKKAKRTRTQLLLQHSPDTNRLPPKEEHLWSANIPAPIFSRDF